MQKEIQQFGYLYYRVKMDKDCHNRAIGQHRHPGQGKVHVQQARIGGLSAEESRYLDLRDSKILSVLDELKTKYESGQEKAE